MIPLILNTPESMAKVRVITMRDDSEKTLKALHRVGVLHVETSEELKPVDRVAIEHERSEVSELLTYVNNVLDYMPGKEKVSPAEDIEVIYTRPFGELSSEVVSLCTRLTNLYQRIVERSEAVKQLTELKRYLEPLARQIPLRVRDLNFSGDYLFSRVLLFPSDTYESLHDKLKSYLFESVVTTIENETVFYAIGKVEDQRIIESLVTEAGGEVLQIPDEDFTLLEFLEGTEDRIHSLEQEMAELSRELQSKTRENLERLVLMKEVLVAESERLSVLGKASEAKYVTLIEGWIPENNIEPAISELRDSIDYVFIDTRKPEPAEEPPTKLRNLRGIKPFQVIVNLFGIPKYGKWDPTPIIALSFAVFFGLMLGDVVYALGVLLLAKFLLPRFTDNPESENFKLFQRVLYISGSVALVVGLLTGAYLGDFFIKFFGRESLALVGGVERWLGEPILFIGLAIIIGFIHVNIGHVLGLIRGVKEGNKGAVLGKIGLFTLQLAGIPYITSIIPIHTMLDINIVPQLSTQIYTILGYILLLSIVLIVVASIMERGKFLGSIFWLFDLTGILGDVMSYARIAGVGLATFYLAFCFNLIAGLFLDMIPGVGIILAVVILLVGHMINLVLGMLTGFIHSLRLCFVEFLFKFYEGGGREYSPFRLRTQAPMVIRAKS
jgi:V/A-type H+-transporting ATPase subunit I